MNLLPELTPPNDLVDVSKRRAELPVVRQVDVAGGRGRRVPIDDHLIHGDDVAVVEGGAAAAAALAHDRHWAARVSRRTPKGLGRTGAGLRARGVLAAAAATADPAPLRLELRRKLISNDRNWSSAKLRLAGLITYPYTS